MEKLLAILEHLLAPGGCPWDQKQTVQSLRKYMEEESREVLAALDSGNDDDLCEELGDLLFNILFMARVAQKEGRFDLDQVVEGIAAKLIRRHPHVFGDVKIDSIEELYEQWDRIKAEERVAKGKGLDYTSLEPGTP